MGAKSGWEKLTLHDVARSMGIKLGDIHREFPQKDDLVDAWLDRADTAMLKQFPDDVLNSLNHAERLETVLLAWLDTLAEYHKLTGEMLLYKLEPGHIHLQAAGVLRISRTVQWFREAAELKADGIKRIGQEIALSSLFVATFIYWLNDKSEQQTKTKQFLRKRLQRGERLNLWQ